MSTTKDKNTYYLFEDLANLFNLKANKLRSHIHNKLKNKC